MSTPREDVTRLLAEVGDALRVPLGGGEAANSRRLEIQRLANVTAALAVAYSSLGLSETEHYAVAVEASRRAAAFEEAERARRTG